MSLASPSPIDAANEQALQRIYAARPYLVAVHPARELLPQLRADTILARWPTASVGSHVWSDAGRHCRGGAVRRLGR